VMAVTAVPATSTKADPTHAVRSAGHDVLDHAIAFTPTVVTPKGVLPPRQEPATLAEAIEEFVGKGPGRPGDPRIPSVRGRL